MRKKTKMQILCNDAALAINASSNRNTKRKWAEATEAPMDHDTWNYGLAKLPRASAIFLAELEGILPFDGVRNPSSRSSSSHKVFFPYRTPANNWVPRVGIAESAAEAAASFEVLISPKTYDLALQPHTVSFRDEDGVKRNYTHDLLVTFRNGYRRLIFMRNEESLNKPRTQCQIRAIAAATSKKVCDDMIVVNANDYTRQRRENLMRLHHFVFHPDDESDKALLQTARSLKSFFFMKDLFPHAPVSTPRAFASCYRLIAQGVLRANLDHVLWENSRVEMAA